MKQALSRGPKQVTGNKPIKASLNTYKLWRFMEGWKKSKDRELECLAIREYKNGNSMKISA
jgi:hypothetical protein